MNETELMNAIQSGDLETLKRALAQQPELAEAKNEQGVSAILLALYHRKPEMAQALASHRAELDHFEAAAMGDANRLSSLLQASPTLVDAFSADGFTALHFACFFNRPEAAKLLLEQGAEVNLQAKNPMKVRPLHSAAATGNVSLCGALLDAGADPDARQQAGYTALMSAALHGNLPLVELLLRHGATASLCAEDGATAASLAEKGGHEEAVAVLGG